MIKEEVALALMCLLIRVANFLSQLFNKQKPAESIAEMYLFTGLEYV